MLTQDLHQQVEVVITRTLMIWPHYCWRPECRVLPA